MINPAKKAIYRLVNIFRKLRVSSRTEAVLHALKEGWLTLDDLPNKDETAG